MGRRGRRLKQLSDNLKKKRRYSKLKDEALESTLWRTHFGTGSSGNAVKQKCLSLSGCARYGMDSSNKGHFFRSIKVSPKYTYFMCAQRDVTFLPQ
jgi:hypothetical protein